METKEREQHRAKCMYHDSGRCLKETVWSGWLQMHPSCEGDCRRMKEYDRSVAKK